MAGDAMKAAVPAPETRKLNMGMNCLLKQFCAGATRKVLEKPVAIPVNNIIMLLPGLP